MLLKPIVIAIMLLYIAPSVSAQGLQAAVNFSLGQPQEEFREKVEDWGYGVGGTFAFRPTDGPLLIGVDGAIMNYGNEVRQEPFSYTIPDVTVEVETTNNILLLHALARLQVNRGALRPYMDGFVGIHYLSTETKVRSEDYPDEEPIATSVNHQDLAFSYGLGGGVMLLVHGKEEASEWGRERGEMLIDFRVRYSLGGEVTYLKKGSITRENGAASIDPLHSRTDLMTYQVGVVFNF